MIYPQDPNGPFGHEYPKGFLKWYMLIIVGAVALGYLFLGGQTDPNRGFIIQTHCGQYEANEAFYSCLEDLIEKGIVEDAN